MYRYARLTLVAAFVGCSNSPPEPMPGAFKSEPMVSSPFDAGLHRHPARIVRFAPTGACNAAYENLKSLKCVGLDNFRPFCERNAHTAETDDNPTCLKDAKTVADVNACGPNFHCVVR